MQKTYSRRMNIEYDMFNRFSWDLNTTMIRCECGKKFKKRKGKNICPKCGNEITPETTVILSGPRKLIWFNTSTVMFIDDDKITISMILLSLYRNSHQYYPEVGEYAFRLRVRYDIKKRTAIAYTRNLRCDKNMWERVKLPVRFLNFTQPCMSKIDDYDIVLPDELVEEFCKIIGVKKPKKLIGVKELAWLNRTRLPYEEAMREYFILNQFNDMKFREKYYGSDEEFLFYKRIVDKVKRYLRSFKKPKDYDKSVFEALCRSMSVKVETIPKNLIKYYYKNPVAICFADIHSSLFKNRDVRINAILNETESSSKFYNCNSPERIETIQKVFGNEVNILKKLKGNGDYSMLYDTAKMIKEIREKEHKFKTKGKLEELHRKAVRTYMKVFVPRGIVFKNTQNLEDIKIGSYTFIYAKMSDDLIDVGDEMDICVASYYNYCENYGTKIVYVRNVKGRAVACLEIDRRNNLVQAKSRSNTKIPVAIQKAILEFSIQKKIYISTRDIQASIRNLNQNALDEDKKIA